MFSMASPHLKLLYGFLHHSTNTGSVSWSRVLLQQLQTRYGAAFHGTPIGIFRASGQQLRVRQLAYLALDRLKGL